MKNYSGLQGYSKYFLLMFSILGFGIKLYCQTTNQNSFAFNRDSILAKMYLVNEHFKDIAWKNTDRNWIRGTYYTGLMAFYKVSLDPHLLIQAENWAKKHGWRTGTEWFHPANRLTCTQTYLELYLISKDKNKIARTLSFMDRRVSKTNPAADQGYYYVDALYVGIPAYLMMSRATGNPDYKYYGNRIFWEVVDDLYDQGQHLFYRDQKAKAGTKENRKPEFWSRGNGWAIASIPRILENLPPNDSTYGKYVKLLKEMASSIKDCQGKDGFWRTHLTDQEAYPSPESSGTAFFTFAISWGINNGFLNREQYMHVVDKSWSALYHVVDENGKVCWGQLVSRDPGNVNKTDSHEYVSGAFLLAASEVLKLIGK
ncbi:MAG: glycoside hydrolase family 88 protein [Bacteroidales bacterium]|nr:glycoside hydrolase family 88 protein [Bacteroidales bacterium]